MAREREYYVGDLGGIQPGKEGVPGWDGPYSWAEAKAASQRREAWDREHPRERAPLAGEEWVPPPPRFPSSPETRRQILNAIAEMNSKYAKPFDKGKISLISLVGTESWAELGEVVLQMAILDTMLSIEEKLGRLLEAAEQGENREA